MFLVAMLRAAFDMRYEYQPPMWLSEMEPTRADRHATSDETRSAGGEEGGVGAVGRGSTGSERLMTRSVDGRMGA